MGLHKNYEKLGQIVEETGSSSNNSSNLLNKFSALGLLLYLYIYSYICFCFILFRERKGKERKGKEGKGRLKTN